MLNGDSTAYRIAQIFQDHCIKNNYQVKSTKKPDNDLRLEISNLKDRAIVNIYHTAAIVIQGSQNTLRKELEDLKRNFENDPNAFLSVSLPESKGCAVRYDIMLPEFRESVKVNLSDVHEVKLSITDNPKTNVEYTAKMQRGQLSTTITQFSNGTLLLQGKSDSLFNDCCNLVELLCNPSEKDVISRFISGDEDSLKAFAAKYTPELIELAEKKIKAALGNTYEYLEPYDQKWFVASECISMTEIPLPEYSPVVMPAAKAFEGFAKKLLIEIGLFPIDYFKDKKANFGILCDNTHPARKAICDKDKYCDTYLKKLNVCMDMSRNFVMHSDDAKVTKIESPTEARDKLDIILKDTKEIFQFFNDIFKLR